MHGQSRSTASPARDASRLEAVDARRILSKTIMYAAASREPESSE
jgi:hypothetical protein